MKPKLEDLLFLIFLCFILGIFFIIIVKDQAKHTEKNIEKETKVLIKSNNEVKSEIKRIQEDETKEIEDIKSLNNDSTLIIFKQLIESE